MDPDKPCKACGGSGHLELHDCPRRSIPPEVVEFSALARFAEKGNLPAAGGVLNQTPSFLQALEAYRSDDAMWEADRLERLKPKPNE